MSASVWLSPGFISPPLSLAIAARLSAVPHSPHPPPQKKKKIKLKKQSC